MVSSEEEAGFDIVFDATGVQPYMFELLANVSSEEIASDTSSADDSSDEDTNRIGNADWYVDTFNLCIYASCSWARLQIYTF